MSKDALKNKDLSFTQKIKRFWLPLVFLLIGCAMGFFGEHIFSNIRLQKAISSIQPLRENTDYKFIGPLLGYDFTDVKNFTADVQLQTMLTSYINTQITNKTATDISLYFRNLKTGAWVGHNQDDGYHPASLMKVAIMIAYYKDAENDPSVLQKNLVFSSSINQQQATDISYNLPTSLSVGKTYNVETLIENMIINSDNGAETLLYDNINASSLNDVYTDLGLPNPNTSSDYLISAKQYALLLRVLYNATYLSQTYSEKALSIMSQAIYKDGIIAGLPNGIIAAQKYGEHITDINGIIQGIELHNCGIVYAKNTYELCVMTKGTDETQLKGIIKQISKITYDHVQGD